MLHAVSTPVGLLERVAESTEAGMQQLPWLCLQPAASPLVYNYFVLVKIHSVLQLCKYMWNTDITRFYIASQC